MRMTDLRSDHHLSGKAAFTRAVQRTLSRTKAKVLQRVGKVEKTTDETFDENVANFQKQQSAATRIQKEIQNYITCVRAMTQATHSLHTAIQTTYEMEWLDYNSIDAALKDLNLAAISYETELTQKVYADLSSYIDEFPAYKMKIQKRRRKMLDYDNAKHDFDSMSSSKKPDHAKICKSQEAMLEAQRLFDEINQEMHHELPAFYEYRVPFLANNLNDLYSSANTYHAQSVRATETLTDMLQTLVTNHNEEMVRLQRSANHGGAPEGYNSEPGSPVLHHNIRTSPLRSPSTRLAESTPKTKVIVHQTASHAQHPASHNNESEIKGGTRISSGNSKQANISSNGGTGSLNYDKGDLPSTSQSSETNRRVLYQVYSTHPYVAEDEDELAFDSGELINVVEFSDSDDQDEGWLMGIGVTSGRKGVFPANFTQRLQRK